MTHTADQIIEAMARAIVAQVTSIPDPEEMALAKKQARAAYAECLRMLRGPTDKQCWSGKGEIMPDDMWIAMIDERIKELG